MSMSKYICMCMCIEKHVSTDIPTHTHTLARMNRSMPRWDQHTGLRQNELYQLTADDTTENFDRVEQLGAKAQTSSRGGL